MFDTINGIPLHPLVVHAVVVLLPVAVLGTLAIVARPAWRRSYGALVVGAAALGAALTPIATSSGEELERRVGRPGEHAELGDQLIWFALALLAVSTALVVLDRRAASTEPTEGGAAASSSSRAITVVAVLCVVAALATAVQVYRVGDSGARAAWCERVQTCTAPAD